MKLFLLFYILLTLAWGHDLPIRQDGGSISYATDNLSRRRGELIPPQDVFEIEQLNSVLFSEMKNQNKELKKVKYYLINGELRLAKVYLANLAYKQTKLRPVIHRYLAIMSFIEGNFEKTYQYLSEPTLQNIPQFGKICTLKVLTQIVLSKVIELENDWARCKVENPGNFKERNLIWLETLVEMKLYPRYGITKIPFRYLKLITLDAEETKVMLKLALYLNQESMVLEQLSQLTVDQLQDPEVRELMGQIYFRSGALAKSYKLVSDLKSPNSENIKGNLYILRNKYELAYAQFKLALEQKQNSQNAIERLLPLAWLLGDWEGGSKYAEQAMASPQTQINKNTLLAAFLMQKGDYKNSEQILEKIAQRSRRGTEIEVTQIASFNALVQNKQTEVHKQANLSCEQYDVINCWLLFQLQQWDSFPLTIRREEKMPEKKEWEKLVKDDLNSPLNETRFVNQLDIEEMDDKLIQLRPKD